MLPAAEFHLGNPPDSESRGHYSHREFPVCGVGLLLSSLMQFTQLAGILPAVVFPVATTLQLVRMLRRRSSAGVDALTWFLFGFANLALYFYAERYTEWQAIVGMLLTALIDFVIVGLAWVYHRRIARSPGSVPA